MNAHASPTGELVRAGFHCVEKRHSVRYWWCGVGFNQWDPGDRLLRKHARYSPRCPLLVQLAGRMYNLRVLHERDLTADNNQLFESSPYMLGVLGT